MKNIDHYDKKFHKQYGYSFDNYSKNPVLYGVKPKNIMKILNIHDSDSENEKHKKSNK